MKYKVLSIKRFVLLIVLFVLNIYFLILNTESASAEGVSLRVAPSLLQIRVLPPSDINAPLTIENLGNETLELKPQFKLFKASPESNGKLQYVSGADNKADVFQNIQLKDGDQIVNELSLGAKQKKQLTLKILVSPEDALADSYFSLIFVGVSNPNENTSNSSGQTSASQIHAGVAMNVLLSVGGKTEAGGEIEEFSAPRFVQKGPVPFTVKIRNTPSQYINPKGNITIKNMFGQTIGKVDLPATTILANSSRYLINSQNKLNPTPNTSPRGEAGLNPKALWPESFLLGFYEAKLTLELSDTTVLTDTIRFTALPMRLLAGFITAILLLLVIYRRVKVKMAER